MNVKAVKEKELMISKLTVAPFAGLGKTLQATAIVAASHVEARSSNQTAAISLIVCPQVLVGHWAFEIEKFVGQDTLVALAYEGTPGQRQALRKGLQAVDVVAMSYETLRSEIEWVQGVAWNYCILDEGHIIRNPRSKINQVLLLLCSDCSRHCFFLCWGGC